MHDRSDLMGRIRATLARLRRARPAVLSVVLMTAAVIVAHAFTTAQSDGTGGFVGVEGPPQLEQAMQTLVDQPCLPSDEAEPNIMQELSRLGYSDWTITEDADAGATGCVTIGVDAAAKRIIIQPALRPEVRAVLEEIGGAMVDTCMTKTQAIDFVTSKLHSVGETNWELRTDGPRGGPANRTEEIKKRVEQGCYLYGGMGWKPDGTRVYLIGGTLE